MELVADQAGQVRIVKGSEFRSLPGNNEEATQGY